MNEETMTNQAASTENEENGLFQFDLDAHLDGVMGETRSSHA